MIFNASSVPLSANPGTLPNVQGAMLDYFQKLAFVQIEKQIVNFNMVEIEVSKETMGVRQPMSAQKLMLKPEGQRAWRWETIHAFPDILLNPDDIISFSGIQYRVMEKLDWKEYGYVELHVTQDYTP